MFKGIYISCRVLGFISYITCILDDLQELPVTPAPGDRHPPFNLSTTLVLSTFSTIFYFLVFIELNIFLCFPAFLPSPLLSLL